MRNVQEVREQLELFRQQLTEAALIIEEEEARGATTSTRLEGATDEKVRLDGAVDALQWVLGEEHLPQSV